MIRACDEVTKDAPVRRCERLLWMNSEETELTAPNKNKNEQRKYKSKSNKINQENETTSSDLLSQKHQYYTTERISNGKSLVATPSVEKLGLEVIIDSSARETTPLKGCEIGDWISVCNRRLRKCVEDYKGSTAGEEFSKSLRKSRNGSFH
ncbi:hypothetical protein H5410_026429 [Solanum commersonii]|uniref:Uncharacterized protein n=1 Tax=Solanum commersonii TaxID=4109 RepID=A0A9J5YWI9_SOLCO|nr:hypothetical protein H5410_026429 [Solanum commersonii]